MQVSGMFDVSLQALESATSGNAGIQFGRRAINKTFHGSLSGTSQGEMLSAITTVSGSAGYVAIEQVTANLAGKQGGFVLQHVGVMNRGTSELRVDVIPDSGSGDLCGISGVMNIRIEAGQHYYDFEYQIAG